jgi:hypothetical protein
VSKSGTLTYQMMYELRDLGFSSTSSPCNHHRGRRRPRTRWSPSWSWAYQHEHLSLAVIAQRYYHDPAGKAPSTTNVSVPSSTKVSGYPKSPTP